jgi:hypothetical protein
MRAPLFAAGVATLFVLPWLVRDWVARSTLAIFTLLLALSPLSVLYSRHARPYALTCLLVFVALVAFHRWWNASRDRRGWAGAYLVATFLAGWLSLVTLPFTLAPFAFYGSQALWTARRPEARREGAAKLSRVVVLGALAAVPLAAAIGPPLWIDGGQIAGKAGHDLVTLRTLWIALSLQLGVGSVWIGAAMLALATWGAVRLAQEHPALVRYFGFVVAVALAAVVAARPAWIQHGGVLARYMIPALPLLLLATARGVADLVDRLPFPGLRIAVVIAAAVPVFGAGPLPGQLVYPTQFGAHLSYWFAFDPAHNPYRTLRSDEPVPAFYRRLATLPPGSRTLVEAPWRLESHYNPLAEYQDVHRQRVRVGFVTPLCGSRSFGEYPEGTGLFMRHFTHLSALLRGETRGADYLVMHLDPRTTPPDAVVEWPDVTACLPAIEAKFGAPVYRDARIVVYPLKPERRAGL